MAPNNTSHHRRRSANLKAALATAAVAATLGGWAAFGARQATTTDVTATPVSESNVTTTQISATATSTTLPSTSSQSTSSATSPSPSFRNNAVTTTRSSR